MINWQAVLNKIVRDSKKEYPEDLGRDAVHKHLNDLGIDHTFDDGKVVVWWEGKNYYAAFDAA